MPREQGDPAAGFGCLEWPALCGRIMFEPIHIHVSFTLKTLALRRNLIAFQLQGIQAFRQQSRQVPSLAA